MHISFNFIKCITKKLSKKMHLQFKILLAKIKRGI